MVDIRPVRLRLSRARGFDLQALSLATNGLRAVNIARPSRWGNTFRVGSDQSYYTHGAEVATAEQCVEQFERFAEADRDVDPAAFETWIAPLRGRNLACWCALGAPCHGDVLLRLAAAPVREKVA